jgi:hypothetical protein
MITPAEINRRNREHYGQEPERPTSAPYERRFVAFVDILAWKDVCRDPMQHARVSAVAKTLSELPQNFSRYLKHQLIKGAVSDSSHQKTEVVTFSDSLVISTPVDVGYTHFFKFLTIVCRGLLTKGFLTRGGVTVGDLFQKESMVFGPALIDAVALEQKEAIYPRLLCSRDLIAEIKCSQSCDPGALHVTLIDHLGRSVVNLLAFERGNPAAWPDLAKRITDTINLGNLPDNHLEKWRYMRDVLEIMIQSAGKR